MNILELKNNNIITRHIKNLKEAEFKLAEAEHAVITSKLALYEAEIELKRAMEKIEKDKND